MAALVTEARAHSEEDLARLLATGSCERCDLIEADLSGIDLTGAILRGAKLNRANLSGTTFSWGQLGICRFNLSEFE